MLFISLEFIAVYCGKTVEKLWKNCGKTVEKLWKNCG